MNTLERTKNINLKEYLGKSWQVIALTVIAYLLQYFFFVYLAKHLLPADFGDFSVAFSMAILFSKVAELGGVQALQKFLPIFKQGGDTLHTSGIIRFFILISMACCVLIAILAHTTAYLDVQFMKKIGSDEYHPLVLSLWMLPLFCLMSFASAILKSYGYFFWSLFPTEIMTFFLAVLLIWLQTSLGYPLTDWRILILLACAYAAVISFQQFLIFKLVPKKFIIDKPIYEAEKWLKISVPIMVSSLGYSLLSQIDLLMVEALATHESSVGYFSAALKTSSMIYMLTVSLGVIFTPLFGLASSGRTYSFQNILRTANRYNFFFCVPLFLVIIIFGKIILSAFGPDYAVAAYTALVYLSISLLISSIFGNVLRVLQFSGFGVHILIIQILAVLITLVLNMVLIPKMGITGCAITRLIAMVFMIASLNMVAFKKMKLKPF